MLAKKFEFEVLLAKVVISRDADALRSLIESRASADDNFAKNLDYPKVAALLAPEEKDWLRIQLGGKEDRREPSAVSVSCIRLVSVLEIANYLEFPYLDFRQFLLNKYKVYAIKKGDHVVAEGTPFSTIAIACLDFVVTRD